MNDSSPYPYKYRGSKKDENMGLKLTVHKLRLTKLVKINTT